MVMSLWSQLPRDEASMPNIRDAPGPCVPPLSVRSCRVNTQSELDNEKQRDII